MELPLHKVICHVDLDAFYAQVEIKRDPERLRDQPVAVVQYNPRGDLRTYRPEDDRLLSASPNSIIAVSYEARSKGVKRNMRGDDAAALCPGLKLVQVPTAHGKADLSLYRSAGAAVLAVLAGPATRCERASIDEAYLDLTEAAAAELARVGGPPFEPPADNDQIFIVGAANNERISSQTSSQKENLSTTAGESDWWWHRDPTKWGPGEAFLAAGMRVGSSLRARVLSETGYTCSAGVAHTKLLAKLGSGLRKPNAATLVPAREIPKLMETLPLGRLRSLGGKFGRALIENLGVQTASELARIPLKQLENAVGERDAAWLAALARGIDGEEVTERRTPLSLSCGKTFPRNVLRGPDEVLHWLRQLALELEERLIADREDNRRVPTLLTISWNPGQVTAAGSYSSVSRSRALRRAEAESMAEDAAALIRRWVAELEKPPGSWSISSMFLEVSKFVPLHTPITNFFAVAAPAERNNRQQDEESGIYDKEQETTQVNDDDERGSHSHGANKLKNRDTKTQPVTPAAGRTPAGRLLDPQTEVFLAELPPDMSRELRIQLEFERLHGKFASSDAKKEGNSRTNTSNKRKMRSRTVGPLDAFLGK